MRYQKTVENADGRPVSGPATPCVKALWTDDHTRLQEVADKMFALVNDGTRPEMEVWEEVYDTMEKQAG